MTKRGDLRLRDSQHLGSIGLREPARFKHLIQGIGKAQLGLTLDGIRDPRSANTFPVPRVTGSLRSAFRLAIVLLVIPLCAFQAFSKEIDVPFRGPDAGWRLLLKHVKDAYGPLKSNGYIA